MSRVKNGDTVTVHYTGRLADGTVFNSSREREPLVVNVGSGDVIAGFEKGLVGMAVGETRTLSLEPEEAYGDHRDDLVVQVETGQFPDHITPRIGEQLQVRQPDGSVVEVEITNIEDGLVTLDANHPLAGERLLFDVEIMGIG